MDQMEEISRPEPALEVKRSESPSKKTPCGTLYLTVAFHKNGRICRILPSIGQNGQCLSTMFRGITWMMKLAVNEGCTVKDCEKRTPISLSRITKAYKDYSCHNNGMIDGENVTSCLDALAKMMEKYLKEEEKKNDTDK